MRHRVPILAPVGAASGRREDRSRTLGRDLRDLAVPHLGHIEIARLVECRALGPYADPLTSIGFIVFSFRTGPAFMETATRITVHFPIGNDLAGLDTARLVAARCFRRLAASS